MTRARWAGLAIGGLAVALVALLAAGRGATAPPSDVTVSDAFTTEGSTALAVYFDLANGGGGDAIVGAEVVGAVGAVDRVTLHQRGERDGLTIMEPTDAIDIAATSDHALVPAGAHVMLEGLAAPVEHDDVVRLRLDLRRGDDVEVDVRVVTADEAVALTTVQG